MSIATRKVGTSVDCPKCSHPNVVPAKGDARRKEEPKAASASKLSKAFESTKFDRWLGRDVAPADRESPAAESEGSESGEIEAVSESNEPAATGSESVSAVVEPWKREPEGLPESRVREDEAEPLTISAAAAVPLAILVVVLLLTAFGLGVVVGRFAWPSPGEASKPSTAAPAAATANTVAEEELLARAADAAANLSFVGQVTFVGGERGQEAGDEGATVLALPSKVQPAADRKIPAVGLRPADEDRRAAVERLKSYGGSLAVVGSDGSFRLPIAQPESYWILILSKHAPRDPQNKLFKAEEDTLGAYIDDVSALLGDREFRLLNRVAKAGQAPSQIECEFRSPR